MFLFVVVVAVVSVVVTDFRGASGRPESLFLSFVVSAEAPGFGGVSGLPVACGDRETGACLAVGVAAAASLAGGSLADAVVVVWEEDVLLLLGLLLLPLLLVLSWTLLLFPGPLLLLPVFRPPVPAPPADVVIFVYGGGL